MKVPSFQLFYLRQFVAIIPLNQPAMVVGRQTGCHLRLIDASISREHARLSLDESGVLAVEDLNSTNGTLVNGERVTKKALKPMDVVELGECSLLFQEVAVGALRSEESGFFRRLRSRAKSEFSSPRGTYVWVQDDLVTEFDASAFKAEANRKSDGAAYLRRIPRLKVIDQPDDEVTRRSEIPPTAVESRPPEADVGRRRHAIGRWLGVLLALALVVAAVWFFTRVKP